MLLKTMEKTARKKVWKSNTIPSKNEGEKVVDVIRFLSNKNIAKVGVAV